MTASDAMPPQLPASLLRAASQWAAEDPDPATAAQLRSLLGRAEAGDPAAGQELGDAFSGTLQFGTAGLRAALGPGPMRMNRVVVRRAAAGLAAFLGDAVGRGGDRGPGGGSGPGEPREPSEARAVVGGPGEPGESGAGVGGSGEPRAGAVSGSRPRAVVGYDARHNSDIFARETAAIFAAAGIEAFLLPSALPTPVLAYAVRALDCDGGVMVTASHNPPQDNGYKVYLGGRAVDESARGAQIVAPFDARIAAWIEAVGPVADIQLAPRGWTVLNSSLAADYEAAVTGLAQPGQFPSRTLKIVLTPMHGVGGDTAVSVLQTAGFTDVTVVAEQARPDPDFPTVSFPNPEEPGALDLALAEAARLGADIVLANDPDADRAAVAAVDPDTGSWRMLRGDEVGALLGAHMVARVGGATGGVFANSIVSSRLLAKIARANGFGHVQTLTGFKWISRVPGLVYGYEEALGYCVAPELVRDKDGISAGLLIAELAAAAKATGRTIFDTLDDLALAHGLHASDQLSVRVADLGLLDAMMERLRERPPTTFGDSPVDVAVDLAQGSDQLPPTDGLLYVCRDETRVIIRPSGTEPKLKCYLEVITGVSSAADLPAARQRARAALDAVLEDVREALRL